MYRSVRLALFALSTVAAVALPILVHAQPTDAVIGYYEPVELRFANPNLEGSQGEPQDSATLRFYAFGKSFDADLRRNFALTRRLPAEKRLQLADLKIWEGNLGGIPGSWVRLTQDGDYVSGAVWDGLQMYRIERYEFALPRILVPDASHADSTIVYMVTYSPGSATDIVIDIQGALGESARRNVSGQAKPSLKPALSEGLEVEIGAVGDVEFTSRFGSRSSAEAISQINIADALFVQQLGVHLTVADVQMFETEPDPFSANDAELLLTELEAFKGTTPAFAALDLAHLFTNKLLDDGIVGIANRPAVCATVQGVGLSSDGRIVAHEIAHNLGAPHDAEAGSPCENEPTGYVMDPEFQLGDNSSTFSACSIEAMRQTVTAASCLSPIPTNDASLAAISTPTSVPGNEPFNVYFELAGAGTEDIVAIEVAFEAQGAVIDRISTISNTDPVDCSPGPAPLCVTHRLESGRSMSFRVSVVATQTGPISLSASVWTLNDSDPANNEASVVVDVVPAINLKTSDFLVAPEVAIPGDIVTVSTSLANAGLANATAVEVRIDEIPAFFEFLSASLPGGSSCAAQSTPNVWLCPVGDLSIGQQVPIEFTLRALDPGTTGNTMNSGDFSMSFSGAQQDVGPGAATATLRVNSAIVDAALTVERRGSLEQGKRLHAEFTIENRGPDSIHEIAVEVRLPGVEIDTHGDSFCFYTPGASNARCEIRLTLEAGESTNFYLSGLLPRPGSYVAEATMEFVATDPEPGNNTASMRYVVVAPKPSTPPASSGGGGGGGGGALDPVWMLILLLCGCWFRCPSRLPPSPRP